MKKYSIKKCAYFMRFVVLISLYTCLTGCIVSVTASSDDGHIPKNTIDGDFSDASRWSAEGQGEWIQYQLLNPQDLNGVNIAFYRGDERKSHFEIWLGNSADTLNRVFAGSSNGTTAGFQHFAFTSQKARYVRIVGLGNSVNDWNSITEFNLEDRGDNDDGGDNNDATPVFLQTFENEAIGSHWLDLSLATVQASCGVNQSRCLRVSYVPYSRGSQRLVKNVSLPNAKEYTLQYDVFFESDFEFVKGGKMHGLGPKNTTTGCDPIETDGWSARVMWRRSGQAEIYNYHQDRQNNCGDNGIADAYFTKGRYQAVSLYVRVNTGQDRSDGEIALFIDGREVSRWQNTRLRSDINQDTEINKFLFSTFHGGSDSTWSPSKTVHARYDNFAVVPGLAVRSAPGEL